MIKRRGNLVVIPKLWIKRKKRMRCPVCGLHRDRWKNGRGKRLDWNCCSTKCTEKYWRQYFSVHWQSVRWKALVKANFTCKKCKWKDKTRKGAGLIGDHIKPIALGGVEFSLKNVQILCEKCNKEKTAQDAKDIAEARRKEKMVLSGQQELSQIKEKGKHDK